jgi:hypothetical protein
MKRTLVLISLLLGALALTAVGAASPGPGKGKGNGKGKGKDRGAVKGKGAKQNGKLPLHAHLDRQRLLRPAVGAGHLPAHVQGGGERRRDVSRVAA